MRSRILVAIAALAFGATSLAAQAGGRDRHPHHDGPPRGERARVVRVEPIVERVRFSVPVEHCWTERERQVRRGGDRTAATVAGGVVGAVIGNRVSDGRGLGTVAGAVAGAVVGSELAGDRGRRVEYRDVRHCEVRHEPRVERRVVAYHVTYEYRGRRDVVRMDHDPGRHVAIRDVRRRG